MSLEGNYGILNTSIARLGQLDIPLLPIMIGHHINCLIQKYVPKMLKYDVNVELMNHELEIPTQYI